MSIYMYNARDTYEYKRTWWGISSVMIIITIYIVGSRTDANREISISVDNNFFARSKTLKNILQTTYNKSS